MSRRRAALAIILGLLGSAPAGGQTDATGELAETQPAENESEPVADQTDDVDGTRPDVSKYTDGPKEVLDEDAVFKQVAWRRQIRDVLLRPRLLDTIDEGWQRLNDEIDMRARLRFGFAYTLLAQWAPDSTAGKPSPCGFAGYSNGAGRARTDDLLHAMPRLATSSR